MGLSRDKGFEIAVDVGRHVLCCRLWGVWNLDLAGKYKYALTEKIAEVHRNGEGWYALADFKAFYPVSEEVQRLIRDYLDFAETEGMTQIVYVGDTLTLRSRLERIFPEYGPKPYVFSESDEHAMQLLLTWQRGKTL